MTRFALTINGHDCVVDVPADLRLLELLRDELGLFGAAIASAVAAACGVRVRSQPIRALR